MSKYAVYVVMVEDTEEEDQRVLTSVDSGERVAGDLDQADAEALLTDLGSGQFDRRS